MVESAETERKERRPSDDYIMGLVEGEGCFSCGIGKYIDHRLRPSGRKNHRKHHAFPFHLVPSFRIGLVKKDAPVLKLVKRVLGCGEIYTVERSKQYKNQRDVCQYYVQTHSDLYKLAEYFKKQKFYTTKGNDFQLWAQILAIIKENRHNTKEGFLEICRLRDKMNQMKGKVRKRSTRKIKSILENPSEHIAAHLKPDNFIHNKHTGLSKVP
ncbi:MAG: LAGLIDADG family homing endonuclease [Candidatus Diapherotrites archaeon]